MPAGTRNPLLGIGFLPVETRTSWEGSCLRLLDMQAGVRDASLGQWPAIGSYVERENPIA